MGKKTNVAVAITSFSEEGWGEGTFIDEQQRQQPIIVPFTAPEDQIIAQKQRKHRGVWQGATVEVDSPSPLRLPPKCLHFGLCGGCRLQHISYELQLDLKRKRLAELLASCVDERTYFAPWIVSPSPWSYRNKMELSFSENREKDPFLGLFMHGSRGKVFSMKECHLMSVWIQEVLEVTRKWWKQTGLSAYHPPSNSGTLRTLTCREGVTTGDRMAFLTVSGNPSFAPARRDIDRWVAMVQPVLCSQGNRASIFLRVQQATQGKPTQFYEMHLSGQEFIREQLSLCDRPFVFHISPSAFFQPNTSVAHKMLQTIVDEVRRKSPSVFYDLYCGTATVGLSVSPWVRQVIGIELSAESLYDAQVNREENGCDNVLLFRGDVGEVLSREELPKPDLVFVDPPRSGLDRSAMQALLSLSPQTIFYLSCNPKSLAENLKELTRQDYRVERVQGFDQFPQTIHFETLVVLYRNTLKNRLFGFEENPCSNDRK